MNLLKLSLLALSLLFVIPASAFLSYLNPFAWFRAAQQSFQCEKNPALPEPQQIEIESFQKIHWVIVNYFKRCYWHDKPIIPLFDDCYWHTHPEQFSDQAKKLLESLVHDITIFKDKFTKKDQEPNLKNVIIEQLKAAENYDSAGTRPESWYKTLKKDAEKQQQKEFKTHLQRKKEFEDWKDKHYKKRDNEIAQGIKNFFDEWRKNNPDYQNK